MKTKLLTAGFLLAASASPITQANFLGVGWDPLGNSTPTVDLGAMDWQPTSFAAKGGNTAILNSAINAQTGSHLSTDFIVYSHTKLGTTADPFDNSNTPSGLNTAYEYTMVLSYVESVTSVNTVGLGSATFLTSYSGASFLEIYYGATRDSNSSSGFGFRNGTLVMKGILDTSVPAATGSFAISNATLVNLDQTGDGNQYTGQKTQSGQGINGELAWKITGQDYRFFTTPIDILNIANISQTLPFRTVNPSDCYTVNTVGVIGSTVTDTECNNVHVNAPLNPATQPLAGFGGFVPNSGPSNTTLTGVDANHDFIAQTDFNSTLTAKQIPEPSSVLLLGVSLLGLLGFSSRRKMS